MKNNIPVDKIEAYLAGLMKSEEKKQFESDLLNNRELKEQVTFIQNLKKVASQDGREKLKQKLQTAENKHARNIESANRRKKIRTFRTISAAASIVILISLSIVLYISQNKKSQLFDEYFQAPENTFLSYAKGSTESEKKQLLTRAAKHYDRQEFEKAAAIFNQQVDYTPELIPYIFLSAISNMAINNTSKAIQELKYIKKAGPENLPVEYFMGLAYLKNGNTEKAITQFKKVAERKGAYNQKATTIIKRLE